MSVINKMLKDLDNQEQPTKNEEQLSYPRIDVDAENNKGSGKAANVGSLKISSAVRITIVVGLGISAFFYLSDFNFAQAEKPKIKPAFTIDNLLVEASDVEVNTSPVLKSSSDNKHINRSLDNLEGVGGKTVSSIETSPQVSEEKIKLRHSASVQAKEQQLIKPTQAESLTPPTTVVSQHEQSDKTQLQEINLRPIDRAAVNDAKAESKEVEVTTEPSFSIKKSDKTPSELAQAALSKGIAAYNKGYIAQAENEFSNALSLQPSLHDARARWSALLYGEQRYRVALSKLNQGISLYPHHTGYRMLAAKIYLKLNNAIQALAALSDFTPAEYDQKFYQLKAGLAQKNKDWHLALSSWQLLLANSGPIGSALDKSKWLLGIAIAYQQLGNNGDAKKHYTQAISAGGLSKTSKAYAVTQLKAMDDKK